MPPKSVLFTPSQLQKQLESVGDVSGDGGQSSTQPQSHQYMHRELSYGRLRYQAVRLHTDDAVDPEVVRAVIPLEAAHDPEYAIFKPWLVSSPLKRLALYLTVWQ
jgi:hypothetical protein